MIYKTLKKVSDVCQVLDKSKLPNTQTVNGITYTVDKVNGTITANGTATTDSNYKTDIALNNAESYTNGGGTKIPSRILFLGCPIGGSQTTYGFYNNWVSSNVVDTGNGGITDTTSNKYSEYYRFALRIIIRQGYTANNLVFKPQLFDLTEMYGAGNEPTTVEEFKQKFPNELYDYKPYCFVKSYKTLLKASDNKIITSYKKSLICTTKNLFDSEDWYNTLHAINSTSMVKETVNGIEYYKFRPQGIYDYEYMKGEFKENTIYTLSCLGMNADGTNNRYTGFQVYYTDGTRNLFYINTGEEQKYTVTTSSNKTIDYIILGYNVGGYVLVRNIQLEEGSTATEYQPYGYI